MLVQLPDGDSPVSRAAGHQAVQRGPQSQADHGSGVVLENRKRHSPTEVEDSDLGARRQASGAICAGSRIGAEPGLALPSQPPMTAIRPSDLTRMSAVPAFGSCWGARAVMLATCPCTVTRTNSSLLSPPPVIPWNDRHKNPKEESC